jgi:hypothetical protein
MQGTLTAVEGARAKFLSRSKADARITQYGVDDDVHVVLFRHAQLSHGSSALPKSALRITTVRDTFSEPG